MHVLIVHRNACVNRRDLRRQTENLSFQCMEANDLNACKTLSHRNVHRVHDQLLPRRRKDHLTSNVQSLERISYLVHKITLRQEQPPRLEGRCETSVGERVLAMLRCFPTLIGTAWAAFAGRRPIETNI